MKPQYILAGSLAVFVGAVDQITKYFVQKNIAFGSGVTVIPGFFDLVHVLNRGAAFGFLNRQDTTWQTYFFIATTILAVAVIAHLLSQADPSDKFSVSTLGLILGGALGNLVDRIRTGEVVDFLDFYVDRWHWPAFNVADIAITMGALGLIFSFYRRSPRKGSKM